MAVQDAIFDAITNSEDKMLERFKISKNQACFYLRAYIMIRLFFFEEFVISDSSINLNQALRTLILAEEGRGSYDLRNLPPADFGELIKNGTIKLAARDIYKGDFADALRNAQNNKRHVTLPSAKYTEMIDAICKEENIYWWNEDIVTQMFTEKIRDYLQGEYSDEVNYFLRDLMQRLSNQETLTYDIVKSKALEMRPKTSEEYRILYDMMRDSYDYNIPEYFRMRYLKRFNGFQQTLDNSQFKMNLPEQYDISWKYTFDAHAFAMAPIDYLKIAWSSGQYQRYKSAMSQYMDGQISFSQCLDALQAYLEYIDTLLVPFYNNSCRKTASKNIILRLKEYKDGVDFFALTAEAGLWTYDKIDAISNIVLRPAVGILELVLTNIFPSIVSKVHEHHTKLPPIEHAIIELDK